MMNSSSSDIDLSGINTKNGFFIKIADRSQDGGDDVYYAKNDIKVKKILNELNKQFEHDNLMDYFNRKIFNT